MRSNFVFFSLAALALTLAACSSPEALAAGKPAREISNDSFAGLAGSLDCPVTQPPQTPFVPPSPWPSQPPNSGTFWFGDSGLWTALPLDGSLRQLALGEKFWWWSEQFDVSDDTTPDLKLTARRLDGKADSYQNSEATNGFHESFNWAMLLGVQLPSPGCWEFTGEYKDRQLTFTLWVPF